MNVFEKLYRFYATNKGLFGPFGCSETGISRVIVIDTEGRFIRLEERFSEDGKKAQTFVTKRGVSRTSGNKPNHLWDNETYVLGFKPVDDKDDNGKVIGRHIVRDTENGTLYERKRLFVEDIKKTLSRHPENATLNAVIKFYENGLESLFASDELATWIEGKTTFGNVTFMLDGEDRVLAEMTELFDIEPDSESADQVCGITGVLCHPKETHGVVPAIVKPGIQAPAISFNSPSYCYNGKKQGENAPVSEEAEFGYTSALKYLTNKNNGHSFYIESNIIVFWPDTKTETSDAALRSLAELVGMKAYDDNGEEEVVKTLKSIYTGVLPSSMDDIINIVIFDKKERPRIKYMAEKPVKEFAGQILRHFEDTRLKNVKQPYQGIESVRKTISGGKNPLPSSFIDRLVFAILNGYPYPRAIYQKCIEKVMSDSYDNGKKYAPATIAFIKGFLNRNMSLNIKESMDKTNNSTPYLLGRLFAIYELIQEKTSNGTQHTVREHNFRLASMRPASAFPHLERLSIAHLSRMNSEKDMGLKVHYQRMIEEVMGMMTEPFPRQLSQFQQGEFIVGYYQQKQENFTPSDKKKEQASD